MPKTENSLEAIAERFSEGLVKTVEAMPEEERPFGAVELTPEEQMNEYMLIRENPQAFVELMREHSGSDEPAIPREVVEYVVEMERRIENA